MKPTSTSIEKLHVLNRDLLKLRVKVDSKYSSLGASQPFHFRSHTSQEALSGIIELEEDPEHVVQGMLRWMYCPGRLPSEHLMDVYKQCRHAESVRHDPDSPKCQLGFFGLFIGLHELADKYDVPGLTQYARIFLDYELRWSGHYDHYGLDFKGLLKIVDKAYNSAGPNDVLRAIMVEHIICQCRRSIPSWTSSICGLFLEHREFAEDLLRSLLTEPQTTRT